MRFNEKYPETKKYKDYIGSWNYKEKKMDNIVFLVKSGRAKKMYRLTIKRKKAIKRLV